MIFHTYRLFKDIAHHDDNTISYYQLKDLVMNIKPHIISSEDTDTVTSKLMEELDINGDKLIDEDEFIIGLTKCLATTYTNQILVSSDRSASNYHVSM